MNTLFRKVLKSKPSVSSAARFAPIYTQRDQSRNFGTS